jgi:hypothetical protein
MMTKTFVLTLAGLALTATSTAATLPVHAHNSESKGQTSTNWGGYVSVGNSGEYKSVSASWVQPGVTCPSKTETDSSFWVGLDGWTNQSQTIEQDGTEADCINGKPVMYGWYEMWPANTQNFGGTVKAGDHITATSVYEGGSKFKLTLADSTQGWHVSTTQTQKKAIRDSAEVVVEADGSKTSADLANFGTVKFSGAQVNSKGIGSLNPAKITMINGKQTVVSVSSFSSSEDFSATYK